MDRRVAIKRISLVMGGALSAPTLAGLMGGCRAGSSETAFVPATLSDAQNDLVTTLAEMIIPETDTPGAKAARVSEFIDRMLTDWYPEADRDRFLGGLDDVDARAREAFGGAFVDGAPEQQAQLMTAMDAAAFPDPEMDPDAASAVRARVASGDVPFFRMLKELTVSGYYTSEVGATQELRVNPMGIYRGDVPYEEIGRAWA